MRSFVRNTEALVKEINEDIKHLIGFFNVNEYCHTSFTASLSYNQDSIHSQVLNYVINNIIQYKKQYNITGYYISTNNNQLCINIVFNN